MNDSDKETIIQDATNRLITAYQPLEIYLFGSYAWGQPDEDSDLDLVVVIDHSEEKSYKRPILGYEALMSMRISNDLIIYTKKEWDELSCNVTTLAYKIKNQGKRLYADNYV